MIKAGVIGGAGYTGGEVIRLLLHHSDVKLSFVQSESQHEKKLYEVHQDFFGSTELTFQKEIGDADVLFLCKSHGESRIFLEKNKISSSVKIIDLSQDFRHKENNKGFVYGLPELNKEKIQKASYIANPGCFATCIQLALLPLAASGNLNSDIHVSATTGSSGAGQTLSATNHFSWRSNNHSTYKTLNHQHEKEITESLSQLQNNFSHNLNFVPQRGAFTRGIYSVAYLKGNFDMKKIKPEYESFYKNSSFIHLVPFEPDVKQVVNTNNCFISLQKEKDNLIIISVIDNLLKGASGQAIQNMNLMFGLPEPNGLKLKPSAF
ncbi:MAG TPA: N-acetyl-gamma-glutamyl-phosphate reductase [Bacteroidia bacterium]|jgi:N-acetyl-gamma-glutamyl-phosphate reductase|nr:N-acetyl-gamma-glutamyl-phosphate reductase [Bacteroidia bacterium]